VRTLALIAFLVIVGAASAITAYELQARDDPARIRPIELEPAREPVKPPRTKRADPAPSKSGGGATPAAPEPAPAGEPTAPSSGSVAPSDDDDGDDDGGGDDDDDGDDGDDGDD
jgi:hypothetical protein